MHPSNSSFEYPVSWKLGYPDVKTPSYTPVTRVLHNFQGLDTLPTLETDTDV